MPNGALAQSFLTIKKVIKNYNFVMNLLLKFFIKIANLFGTSLSFFLNWAQFSDS